MKELKIEMIYKVLELLDYVRHMEGCLGDSKCTCGLSKLAKELHEYLKEWGEQ